MTVFLFCSAKATPEAQVPPAKGTRTPPTTGSPSTAHSAAETSRIAHGERMPRGIHRTTTISSTASRIRIIIICSTSSSSPADSFSRQTSFSCAAPLICPWRAISAWRRCCWGDRRSTTASVPWRRRWSKSIWSGRAGCRRVHKIKGWCADASKWSQILVDVEVYGFSDYFVLRN